MSQKTTPRLDLMPSACDRWMTCSASPRFCLENAHLIPADLSSKFSQEGNTAHEVAAAFLQNREPDPKNCPTPITPEMRAHAWDYMTYVEGLRTGGAGMSKLIVEQKDELWYYPGRNAIVDAAVVNPGSLHIVDYKYGAGVAVSPERNLQTIIYARQVVHHEKLSLPPDFPITSHIYQPRNRESDHPEKTWSTTWGEIKEISDEIADHALVIQVNNRNASNASPLAFAPSEKACRWCPAKAFCPARQAEMLEGIEALAIIDDDRKVLPPVTALPVIQLAAVLKHKSSIEKWLKDAHEYATSRLKEGHEIPGFKLVLSKGGHRFWTDEKKAAELLVKTTVLKRAEVVEETTISPSAAEKLIGKKKFSAELTALIGKPAGSPTVAPSDDKRESCLLSGETEFTDLSDVQLDRLEDY